MELAPKVTGSRPSRAVVWVSRDLLVDPWPEMVAASGRLTCCVRACEYKLQSSPTLSRAQPPRFQQAKQRCIRSLALTQLKRSSGALPLPMTGAGVAILALLPMGLSHTSPMHSCSQVSWDPTPGHPPWGISHAFVTAARPQRSSTSPPRKCLPVPDAAHQPASTARVRSQICT